MTLTVTIDTDNAAFEDDPGELERILRDFVRRVHDGAHEGSLRDANGNRVGRFEIQA